MADTKISALTADSTPGFDSLIATIDDPGGTPASRKTTIAELLTASAATANTALFSPTGYSLTGSDATSAIDIAGTWNTTGTPTAIKLDITNTASNAASLLMDLQVGSVSRFNVKNAGEFYALTAATTGIYFNENGLGSTLAGFISFVHSGTRRSYIQGASTGGLTLATSNSQPLSLTGQDANGAGIRISTNGNAHVHTDAANTLALRNSTNAQTFNIYNTYTNASNYERLSINWDTNVAWIETESAGTGSNRNLHLNGAGGSLNFYTSGNLVGLFSGSIFRPGATGANDIGSTAIPWGEIHGYQFCEKVNAIGSIGGGTQDIDMDSGTVVTGTVDTSTTTFTFSNPSASGTASSFTLILTNGGSQTVNWPASVDWAGGTAPTLTTSGVDVLTFTTVDGGTTWYGFPAGLDMQ